MGRDAIAPSGKSLGATLRILRIQCGERSLTEFARKNRYTKSHISAVENDNGIPSRYLVSIYEELKSRHDGVVFKFKESWLKEYGVKDH